MISHINDEQRYYDEDPERYERQQRIAKENREMELEQERQEDDRQFNDR